MAPIVAMKVWNILPKWHFFHPAGRLIWSSLIFILGTGAVVALTKRPKPAEAPTWAQAMLGAVATFALMWLAYGTIPHEWLQFSNSYLHWNESAFLVHKGQKIAGPIHWLNFDINKRAITDAVAAGIYVVMLGLNVFLFSAWQKRPAAKVDDSAKAGDETVVGTSAYGRPLTAKG
jgi:hypothetical protein